jgi:tRNA pseudouridine38-40 synthase
MQKQPHKKTVQGTIEEALQKLNINTKVMHAGRTDRGVHALNQVIAFKAPKHFTEEKLKSLLNKILAPSIYIKKLSYVNNEFNPRFDAKKRSYRYLITQKFSPFNADYITFYPEKIDLIKINKALKMFEGKHDFEYFAKTGSDVNSYVREIYKADIFQYKNIFVIKIVGNGFLRGQIRLIVDFVLKINENKLSLNDLQTQLAKQKLISKHLAPPNGLYLERIWY